jgi:hypothetical protein
MSKKKIIKDAVKRYKNSLKKLWEKGLDPEMESHTETSKRVTGMDYVYMNNLVGDFINQHKKNLDNPFSNLGKGDERPPDLVIDTREPVPYRIYLNMPDKSEQYELGFQLGCLWYNLMINKQDYLSIIIHKKNFNNFDVFVRALGYQIVETQTENLEDIFMQVTVQRKESDLES